MIKLIYFLFIICLSGCYTPFYRKNSELNEHTTQGYTKKTTIYHRIPLFASKKRRPGVRMNTRTKAKVYTYDKNGNLITLEIRKTRHFFFKLYSRSRIKEYNEAGKQISKRKKRTDITKYTIG